MPSILERLREALASEYRVERELASGGMGSVFLAQDLALHRPVAIKVMRPELATASMASRFLHEARILASLSHSHIVPVHRAGEADGLYYYVMDYVEGETLDRRLRRGPLDPSEAVKLGRDLLDALEAAHKLGIVHRDIKPANIFLMGQRAVLGDFGIARSPRQSTESHTMPGMIIGTPGYMPLEQAAGYAATAQTDICAVGMVLYHALSGRIWQWPQAGERVSWSNIPRTIIPLLRRALAPDPNDRWPDARSFKKALWTTRTRRYVQRTAGLTVAGVVAGALLVWFIRPTPPDDGEPPAASVSIAIAPFKVQGDGVQPGLGDSVAAWLAQSLGGYSDFTASAVGRNRGPSSAATLLTGTLKTTDGRWDAEVREGRGAGRVLASISLPSSTARALTDSLAYGVLLGIWNERSPLAADLPIRALPRSGASLAAWLAAERLQARSLWAEAYGAYLKAESLDSTCSLCSWRLAEVERWLGLEHDPRRTARYRARLDSFPVNYQRVIRAGTISPPVRFDSLRSATAQSRGFFLAWLIEADELFHRGPLSGHLRRESLEGFRAAARLHPEFAPAWEHLAWALIAEGDSAEAREALEHYAAASQGTDPLAVALRGLLETGFAWRFLSPDVAGQTTQSILQNPAIASFKDLAAGPRLAPTFDAPTGAVALGRAFEAMRPRPDLVRSGLIAQVFGHVALGQIGAARDAAMRLKNEFPENDDLALFPSELEVAEVIIDAPLDSVRAKAARRALQPYLTRGAGSIVRRRAAWIVTMLDGIEGAKPVGPRSEALMSEPNPRPLNRLLDALDAARQRQPERALDISEPLLQLDSAGQGGDPAFRALLHSLRASWFEQQGDIEGGRRSLRWHEALDVAPGYPTGGPQAAEFDWALGTAARWRRARLLSGSGKADAELCSALSGVARNWASGDPMYVARADSAGRQAQSLGCRGTSRKVAVS